MAQARSDAANQKYLYEVSDEGTARTLASLGLPWFRATTVGVRANGAFVEARANLISSPELRFGDPRGAGLAAGEVAVSEHMAWTLGLDKGSTVLAGSEPSRVVSIFATSGESHRDQIVLISGGAVTAEALFTSDKRPSLVPGLAEIFQTGSIQAVSVERLAEDAGERALAVSPPLSEGLYSAGVALIMLAALAILATLGARLWRDISSLRQVGASFRERALILSCVCASVAALAVLGAIPVSWLSVNAARRQLSALYGQVWPRSVWGFDEVGLVALGATSVSVVLAFTTASLLRRLDLRNGWLRVSPAIFVVSSSIAVLTLKGLVSLPAGVAAWLAALISLGPTLTYSLQLVEPRGVRAIVLELVRIKLIFILVVGTVGAVGLAEAAYTDHGVLFSRSASTPAIPPGSLAVDNLTLRSAHEIQSALRSVGPIKVRVLKPSRDSNHVLRVISPVEMSCLHGQVVAAGKLPLECIPKDTRSPMNIVAISELSGVRADPTLISDGKVVVVEVDNVTGNIMRHRVYAAAPDYQLGGLLPGAEVGGSDLSKDFGFSAVSNWGMLNIGDFSHLAPDEQARVRAVVLSAAPMAKMTIGDEAGFKAEIARSNGILSLSAALVVVLAPLESSISASRIADLLAVLRMAGARRPQLGVLLWASRSLILLLLSFSAAFGLGGAWLFGVHDGSGFGHRWWTAVGAMLVGSLVAFAVEDLEIKRLGRGHGNPLL